MSYGERRRDPVQQQQQVQQRSSGGPRRGEKGSCSHGGESAVLRREHETCEDMREVEREEIHHVVVARCSKRLAGKDFESQSTRE